MPIHYHLYNLNNYTKAFVVLGTDGWPQAGGILERMRLKVRLYRIE